MRHPPQGMPRRRWMGNSSPYNIVGFVGHTDLWTRYDGFDEDFCRRMLYAVVVTCAVRRCNSDANFLGARATCTIPLPLSGVALLPGLVRHMPRWIFLPSKAKSVWCAWPLSSLRFISHHPVAVDYLVAGVLVNPLSHARCPTL
jgi:hypothetical protein